jgi:hypothetical protein
VPEEPSTRREEQPPEDLRVRLERLERRFRVSRFRWRLALLAALFLIAIDLLLIAIALFTFGHHRRRYVVVAPMTTYGGVPYGPPPPQWGYERPGPWSEAPMPPGRMGPPPMMMQRPIPTPPPAGAGPAPKSSP